MNVPVEVEVDQVRAVEATKRLWHQPERVEINVLQALRIDEPKLIAYILR